MFVPVIPPPPSQKALDLGRKMAELISIFREGNPDLKFTEVRMAMRIAEKEAMRDFSGTGVQTALVIGLVLLVALGGVFVFMFRFIGRPGGTGSGSIALISVIIGLLLVIAAAVVVARRR